MVKGKLERKYRLIHNGRELSKGLLSEAGKYDAMQILVQRLMKVVQMRLTQMKLKSSICLSRKISNGSDHHSGVFLRSWILSYLMYNYLKVK